MLLSEQQQSNNQLAKFLRCNWKKFYLEELLDSNIIIYATQPEYGWLREFIAEYEPAVSALSYIETLGYHRLTEAERQLLEEFFAVSLVLPISQPVLVRAVALRQMRRMTLGDAIIAGTALTHNLIFSSFRFSFHISKADSSRWFPWLLRKCHHLIAISGFWRGCDVRSLARQMSVTEAEWDLSSHRSLP